jgi:hypothetical protein
MKQLVASVMLVSMLMPSLVQAQAFSHLKLGDPAPFEGILYTIEMNAEILATLKTQKDQMDELRHFYETKLDTIQSSSFAELRTVEASYKKQISMCVDERNRQRTIMLTTMVVLVLGGGALGYFLGSR